ncbi:MAG: hypothetical protein JHD02_00870 [Thermoleophilaceae bacterium]|nr:hypothetical protein [Thermoleophilaceae bacterium]
MKHAKQVLLLIAAVVALTAIPAGSASALVPVPIPGDNLGIVVPGFDGSPATAKRLKANNVPTHPFMAPNGKSNIHGDAWQTDTYSTPGPLGSWTTVNSTLQAAECASVAFDAKGRIVSVCVGLTSPKLVLLDPNNLRELASHVLPARQNDGGLFGSFTDFSGGGYFFLDHQDRAVVPTSDRRIQIFSVRTSLFGPSFRRDADYDLAPFVAADDQIVAVMPDWSGRIWFVSRKGAVGNVNPTSGAVKVFDTGERIGNSFAVDETGGVFVVTDAALYRFDADGNGAPTVAWREAYPNTGAQKPGQTQAGSGTTPTLMNDGLVAITDNADPINVAVFKRDAVAAGDREICSQPVFSAGASATDQSLIAVDNSLVAENNYGYDGLDATLLGKTTRPGITKLTVDADNGDCSVDWTSNEISPSAVPKVSTATGLIYTYTKPARNDLLNAWYFTAIDFCTGETKFRRLAGTGSLYNNNFSPVTLAPDGDAYVGVIGGLVRIADLFKPTGASSNAAPAC